MFEDLIAVLTNQVVNVLVILHSFLDDLRRFHLQQLLNDNLWAILWVFWLPRLHSYLFLFYIDESLALIEVAVQDHYEDLQKESYYHVPWKLVVSEWFGHGGHVSVHLGEEEYDEQTDNELDCRDDGIQVTARLLFFDAWEQFFKVRVVVEKPLNFAKHFPLKRVGLLLDLISD